MDLAQQQRELKQIKAEVQLQPKIKHVNVCKQLGFDRATFTDPRSGKTDPVFCFVLELCPNGTLFDHIEASSRWGEKLARSYFHQLIDGLDACHKQDIAHRDLKPENVLLDANFVLKICDFGMATRFTGYQGGTKMMYTHAGTAAYRAPETFSARKGATATGYDKACDIWSAAVVCFIMIAGFPPLKLARRTDWWYDKLKAGNIPLFWRAHEQTAPFVDSTNNGLVKNFIERVLDPNPATRLTIAQIRQHDWYTQETYTHEQCAQELRRRSRSLHDAIMEKTHQQQENAATRTVVSRDCNAPEVDAVPLERLVDATIGAWPDKTSTSDTLEKVCPKLDRKNAMPTRQWFESEELPRDILSCIVDVLKNNDCKTTLNCDSFTIEATQILAPEKAKKQSADKADAKANAELPSTASPEVIKFQVEVRDKGRCMYQVTFRRLFGCPLQYGRMYRRILTGQKGINESYPKLVFIS